MVEITARDAYLHQQAVNTTTPGGRAWIQMMGVFAEFARAMIRDRVNAGLANARAKGVRLGAPRTGDKIVTRIEREKAKGPSLRTIAAKLGVGTGTVHRVLNGEHAGGSSPRLAALELSHLPHANQGQAEGHAALLDE
jgi:DNA invertase Pin-like site-specific DNA recombinase